jgi:hypothetical protein
MFRIDNQYASTILPPPLQPGSPGFYSSGSIGGELATIVTADAMNEIQEELVAVVAAGGLTLDKNDNTQVIQAILALIAGNTRKRLTGPLDLYCANGGNDNNNGLTPSTPFATPGAAYNLLVQQYDLGGQNVTIHLADGNYNAVNLNGSPLGVANPNNITFLGNSGNPANVQINQSIVGGSCFSMAYFGQCLVDGVQFNAPAAETSCVVAAFSSKVFVQNVIYGSAGYYHNWANWGAQIGVAGSYTISGGAARHLVAADGGQIAGQLYTGVTPTITLVGTPHFSTAFAYATNSSFLEFDSSIVTWSGTATGARFFVNNQSGIYVPNGTLTYFPGDTAGTADATTFGLYAA